MPGTTTPDNIRFPVVGDNLTPLATWFANLAADVQAAISSLRSHKGLRTGIASGTYVESVPVALAIGANATRTITFPSGRFTAPPKLSFGSYSGRMTLAVVSVTTTSAQVQIQNNSNGAGPTTNFDWIAVQD